jgi:AAA domain (dynein-related subfamily)
VKVTLPHSEVVEFAAKIGTDQYRDEERDYKLAVHVVLSALLSDAVSQREDFAERIADVFKEAIPDMDALGIAPDQQAFVRQATAPFGAGGLRSAMANLAGGKWGLAQFSWIPRAVEFALGAEVASAFRDLVDGSTSLTQRVETFRDALDVVSQELEKKGGYLLNWRHFRESLSFVALILTGYDPTRYTFYSYGALRHGYARYAPEETWPKGTMGDIYEAVCHFILSVADELKAKGIPVQDLIDAQSFVWISFQSPPERGPRVPEPCGVDIDAAWRDLAKAAYWPEAKAKHLVHMAQRWPHLLFQGPPGTGKTFIAETLARLLAGDEEGRVEVVQFHPSYAYEDFVEGIRPRVTEGSSLAYEVHKGIFMKLAEQAKNVPDELFFLVVDELNRANLPRVFGELLYALEYRGPQHLFRLPYSGAETYIPANIKLIGTMNTADRSIALVDAAIRRRFRHVDFAPDPGVLKAWLADNELVHVADHAAGRLAALNAALMELLDVDRLIGHTYLMREDLAERGLRAPWEEDIEPVLREHLFNQPEEIDRLREVFLASE